MAFVSNRSGLRETFFSDRRSRKEKMSPGPCQSRFGWSSLSIGGWYNVFQSGPWPIPRRRQSGSQKDSREYLMYGEETKGCFRAPYKGKNRHDGKKRV